MVDRLDTAATWLTAKLKAVASVEAVLRGSDGTGFEINPTMGQAIFEGQNYENGLSVRIETRDFLIDVAELIGGYRPRTGDKIEVGSNRFEVFAPDGDHCWRDSSAAEKSIRVHTRKINEA